MLVWYIGLRQVYTQQGKSPTSTFLRGMWLQKKRKITPVSKYRREIKPVGLMLIMVSRDAAKDLCLC